MAKQGPFGQHQLLHAQWPNDCCLCRSEQRVKDLEAEVKDLRAIATELLEVAEDMRDYTHVWDWKYGEYWDGVLERAREAAGAAAAMQEG